MRKPILAFWFFFLLSAATIADVRAQVAPYDIFPPAGPPYFRVRMRRRSIGASYHTRLTTPFGSRGMSRRYAA